jgi:hypothetical protein
VQSLKIAAVIGCIAAASTAFAKNVPFPTHNVPSGPVEHACNDLMSRLQKAYGRRLICKPFIAANGTNISEMSGQLFLVDANGEVRSSLRIRASAASDAYTYDAGAMQTVEMMVQRGQWGMTADQLEVWVIRDGLRQNEADYQFEKAVIARGDTLVDSEGKPVSAKDVEDVHTSYQADMTKALKSAEGRSN